MAQRYNANRRPKRRNNKRYNKGKTNSTSDENKAIELEAVIQNVLPGTMFHVKIPNSDKPILAHISGKMRKRFIKLVTGDKVKIEMSPYDLEKARIVYRMR